uniref:Putative single-stranded DNA binding protein n=1 Tax=Rhodymenia pseudopalmata TaxID=31502 RepID=A0A1C9C7H8_RHOPU|nr:putative single-stranded DNA binding protein [Rhodymenia pseudopalmata]AOM64329.1 putative single-stranded DNA binding protein [Rhodymenia pseudopalmata]
MNICTLTGQVLKVVKVLSFDNKTLTQFNLVIYIINPKKCSCFYKIKTIARGRVAKVLMEMSAHNNFIILEGFIYINKKVRRVKNTKKRKVQKTIGMKLRKIHNLL